MRESDMNQTKQAGKGSRPRPVRGSTYRDNYAAIRWKKRSAVSSQRSAINPKPSTLNRVHQ